MRRSTCSYGDGAVAKFNNSNIKKRQLEPILNDTKVVVAIQSANDCVGPDVSQDKEKTSHKITTMKLECSKVENNNKVAKRIGRPSLSEQLSSIANQADALTKSIRKNAGLEEDASSHAIYSCPARSFVVGNLTARICTSLVYFYSDRCEYKFNHPYETSVEILMVMYYRDMKSIKLANNKFVFHLSSTLHQCFTTSDYNPNNMNHNIIVEFTSQLSMNEVKNKIFPLIKRL